MHGTISMGPRAPSLTTYRAGPRTGGSIRARSGSWARPADSRSSVTTRSMWKRPAPGPSPVAPKMRQKSSPSSAMRGATALESSPPRPPTKRVTASVAAWREPQSRLVGERAVVRRVPLDWDPPRLRLLAEPPQSGSSGSRPDRDLNHGSPLQEKRWRTSSLAQRLPSGWASLRRNHGSLLLGRSTSIAPAAAGGPLLHTPEPVPGRLAALHRRGLVLPVVVRALLRCRPAGSGPSLPAGPLREVLVVAEDDRELADGEGLLHGARGDDVHLEKPVSTMASRSLRPRASRARPGRRARAPVVALGELPDVGHRAAAPGALHVVERRVDLGPAALSRKPLASPAKMAAGPRACRTSAGWR